MRSSRRGARYAVLGFILVTAVVISGMAWATVTTVRLKESELKQGALLALRLMESHLNEALIVEQTRNFGDYDNLYKPELLGWDGLPLKLHETSNGVLASKLAKTEPAYEWIELYFQVDRDGAWSSPQVMEDDVLNLYAESPLAEPDVQRRLRESFDWLRNALGMTRLRTVAAGALRCTCPYQGQPGHENCDCLCARRLAGQDERLATGGAVGEFERRQRTQTSKQVKSLPPAECPPGVADAAWLSQLDEQGAAMVDDALLGARYVEAHQTRLEPFWLEPKPDGGRRLGFVRSWDVDGAPVFQGFLVNWPLLEAELLARIHGKDRQEPLLPGASLVPILESAGGSAETEWRLATIPVRLHIPSLAGGTRATAWRRVRPTLLTSWAVAVTVLFAAGWGIRNLVVLTERRMQFAYAVTHELRTPLTTFRLYSDMLSAGLVPEESKQEYLDTLNHESIRLAGLVEGVLEYARLENQKVRLNPTDTDAASLLDVVRRGLEERCRECGVEASTENGIANGTPLHTDVDLVERIAGVLVNNACRHAGGSDKPAVALHLIHEHGKVHLDVIDSGPGIDRRDARSIFKPFRRGRQAKAAAQGGIGLGLALARSWAKLLGGRLQLHARHHTKYGGAHFRLTIPDRMP